MTEKEAGNEVPKTLTGRSKLELNIWWHASSQAYSKKVTPEERSTSHEPEGLLIRIVAYGPRS